MTNRLISDSVFVGRLGGPHRPAGEFQVFFDADEDILWVGRACACVGEACIHATGEFMDVEEDVVVTINDSGTPLRFVSSIALTHASRHPLWKAMFEGLDRAARAGSCVVMSFPCHWFRRRGT